MFNRDALFGKKDEPQRSDPRSPVNVTPGLGSTSSSPRPQSPAEPPKQDLRFAEAARPQQPQPAARAEEPTGSRLIVGPDIKLKGVQITDCDTLVVEGRVEASMDSRVIQIAENGVFSGTVSIDVAEIRGRFEGELTARKQLVIYSTGRVSGQIHYGKVRIEEGGELSGQISTLTRATATPARETSVAAATAPASASAPGSTAASTSGPIGSRPASTSTAESQTTAAAAREPSRAPRVPGKSSPSGVNTF